jgi:hypothetical protein
VHVALQWRTFLAFLRAALTAAEPLFLADCSSSASRLASSSACSAADIRSKPDKLAAASGHLQSCSGAHMHPLDGVPNNPRESSRQP